MAQVKIKQSKKIATLFEISWEVCNQVGGIYTVIRSKIPAMVEKWSKNYFLIGPYFKETAYSEFEETALSKDSELVNVISELNNEGVKIYSGFWLVTGKPKVFLIDFNSQISHLAEIKKMFYDYWRINFKGDDELVNQVLLFGYCVYQFFLKCSRNDKITKPFLLHFHEWLSAAAIPLLKKGIQSIPIVFTTHATLLGRYLASSNENLYEKLSFYNWKTTAEFYGIEARVGLERLATQETDCFTTVSEVTALECDKFLDRKPDLITPNGLNIERFIALHEFQNLHLEYKKLISQFVMGHFFSSYGFDLDKTLYFFTSGRYEFRNKGFDLTLEALWLLNERLKKEKLNVSIIMFFITKRPFYTINPVVLSSRAMFEEVRNNCSAILKQIESRLLYEITRQDKAELPILNNFIDDYWKLRLRRTLVGFKTKRLPIVVTHNLEDDKNDEILNFLRQKDLVNNFDSPVKIVYHPDFISPTSPLLGMDYGQFVRGCHLGIFPSAYEPWGYTPMECVANGIPAVTSDLSGFGDYVKRTMPDHSEHGIFVVERKKLSFQESVVQLFEILYNFVKQDRRERINQRNLVESRSVYFDWRKLIVYYEKAYQKAQELN